MIRYKNLMFPAMAAALLTACAKSEIETPLQTRDVISFRPSAVHSKAQSLTNDAANPFKTMGIYAAATGPNDYDSATHTANYLQNIEVERTDAAGQWTTAQTYYWPVGKATLFGYAPYNAAGSTIINTAFGAPIIDFTVHSDQTKQIDLLVASAVNNATKTPNAVSIPMKHALTKVGFSARISHNSNETQHINWIRVAKIELYGVYSNGKHAMDAAALWTDLNDLQTEANPFVVTDATENLGGLRSVNLSTTYQQLTLDDGYLFMLPQPFTQSAKLRVYLVADWTQGNKEISFDDPIEFDLAQAGLNWNQGEAVNYNIHIDITDQVQTSSTITAELLPWNNAQVDSDITKRQLNLTRIEVDVFDAAITRVYFSSNQPLNEVYIAPVCYQGALPSAGGAAKGVQEVFTNLTATDPSSAANLHYDPDSGQGYFDIDRVNPNSAQQSYLLYLYAGGLRRSVQVNTRNTNDPQPIGKAPSPFVGTFHRFDEYGERIITWNNTGPWVAVIDPLNAHQDPNGGGGYADYEDVIFDRLVSPAKEAGILHTINPGNAEDYLVSDGANTVVTIDGKATRALMGNGRVYFRVGWRKNSTRATGPINRYAKITIRDQINDMNTSKILGTLFIRKGEAPDYVMRPGDPVQGVYASSTRKDAVKFSSYDVTSPYGNELKDNYYNYPIIASGGGEHLQYPTHGGSYFKWGSGRGISSLTGRFADTPLAGYNKNTHTPNLWSQAIDVCPDGYRAIAYDNRFELVATPFAQPYASLDGLEMVQSLYVKPEQGTTAPYGWLKNTPYPGNQDANWVFGYYADGFFDRGPATINVPEHLEPHTTVQYNGQEGYDGMLVFNPTSLASLFLPATGSISPSIGLEVPGNTFSINLTTRVTGYPTRTINMYLLKQPDPGNPYINTITSSGGGNLHQGESIRCVVGAKKDITSEGKCVVFYAYGYNDRNDLNDQFIPSPEKGALGDSFPIPYGATGKWNTKQNGSGTTYLVNAPFTISEQFTILYAIE